MTGRSGSLGRRLALGAAVLIAVALLFAGTGIGFVLHRFVRGQIDQRLDAQIANVANGLEAGADGAIAVRTVDAPPFDRAGHGWYWQVTDARDVTVARSASLSGGSIEIFAARFRWQEFWDVRPRPGEGRGPRGEPLHLRVGQALAGNRPVTIVASAPRDAVVRPMWEAMRPLIVSLVLLGVALALASLLQVRFGLKPLRRLQAGVADVRAGLASHLPLDQPEELLPLATEINTLLDQNVAGLERARRNVANLAHALKTPLATLAVTLRQSDRPRDAAMVREVERMERQIRHHLGRARAAALNGPARARTAVAPRIDEFSAMFAKVYVDRHIDFSSTIDSDVAAACEPQDLDEILGNVLDNAFKWAGGRVAVSAHQEEALTILIEDDGPGLAEDRALDVMMPGQKLDETVAGDGFGLTIARELAELYNGGIALSRSPVLGGLRVAIALPKALAARA